jgi:hypothetical protein
MAVVSIDQRRQSAREPRATGATKERPGRLWLSCGLLATAAATGLLVLAPAIRRRSRAARLPGGGPAEAVR